MTTSVLERALATHGPEAVYAALSPEERERLQYTWRAWARPTQLAPPGNWGTWLYMAGRGSGKTRAAAESVREVVDNGAQAVALMGREPSQVRMVMIEGESGLLSVFPPHQRPEWIPSRRTLRFHTGAVAHTYSAHNPEQVLGAAYDYAWFDELAAFPDFRLYDELQMALRRGDNPRQVVSTTPRPIQRLRDLINMPSTVLTRDSSYANRANLSPHWFDRNLKPYEGTARGQQEIEGILLDSLPGALWTRAMIQYRPAPALTRVVVAVDPSVGDGETSDECGIVVVGQGEDGDKYVLGDYSLRASPLRWARAAVRAYHEHKADYMVVERNAGGRALLKQNIDLVETGLTFRDVWASKSKEARADNPALQYELGNVFHTHPMQELEDQLCTWIPGEGPSPDRLDALVWGIASLSRKQRFPALG